MPQTLKNIVEVIEAKIEARRTLIAGLIYPAMLLNGAIFLPPIKYLFFDGVVAYLQQIIIPLLVVYGAVGAVFVFFMVMQAPGVRLFFDRLFLRIPGVGGFIMQADVSDAAMALGALDDAGVPIVGALEQVARVPRNAAIAAGFARAHERVKAGESLGDAFAPERDLPVLFRDMVASGQASGQLAESLKKVRQVLADEAKHRRKVAASVLPVVAYLLVAVIVAYSVVSAAMNIYAPYQDLLK